MVYVMGTSRRPARVEGGSTVDLCLSGLWADVDAAAVVVADVSRDHPRQRHRRLAERGEVLIG